MNKKNLLSTLALFVMFSSISVGTVYANEENNVIADVEKTSVQKQITAEEDILPLNPDCPRYNYYKKRMHLKKGCPLDMEKRGRFSPEEMKAKKLEFEKRLNLTDEQKAKIEKDRKKDHKKVKPLFEEMKNRHDKIKEIRVDDSLSREKKIEKIRKEKKALDEIRLKLDKQRKQNMENFESILTEEQKVEFEKIKQEQKAERAKYKFQGKKRMFKRNPVKPMPIEE